MSIWRFFKFWFIIKSFGIKVDDVEHIKILNKCIHEWDLSSLLDVNISHGMCSSSSIHLLNAVLVYKQMIYSANIFISSTIKILFALFRIFTQRAMKIPFTILTSYLHNDQISSNLSTFLYPFEPTKHTHIYLRLIKIPKKENEKLFLFFLLK